MDVTTEATQATLSQREIPHVVNPKDFADILDVTTQAIMHMYNRSQLPPVIDPTRKKMRWSGAVVKFWLDNGQPDRDTFRRAWSQTHP